eukprot:scaffold217325_cov28-Prasinocladus_malaysianus.AAC.1
MTYALTDGMSAPRMEFQPPCHVRIFGDPSSGVAETNVCLYAVPTTPGHCRTFACQKAHLRSSSSLDSVSPAAEP